MVVLPLSLLHLLALSEKKEAIPEDDGLLQCHHSIGQSVVAGAAHPAGIGARVRLR